MTVGAVMTRDPLTIGPEAPLREASEPCGRARLLAEPPGGFLMDLDTFLQHVAAGLGTHAPEGERAVRVVYGALREAVSPGELVTRSRRISPRTSLAFLHQPGALAEPLQSLFLKGVCDGTPGHAKRIPAVLRPT